LLKSKGVRQLCDFLHKTQFLCCDN
jgi:hypothetical protein